MAARSADSRRAYILDQVATRGHVGVRELADDMDVSEATVRRDLRDLAQQQRLQLVYGGATVPRSGGWGAAGDQSIETRAQKNIEAKRLIGEVASELVSDGDLLFVDAGTTCYEMRAHLLRKRNLTVIVNSTRLAIELGRSPEISVIQLGGHYRPDRMDSVGPLAVHAIDQLRGYVAFVGADGLSAEFGLSATDIQTAYLYQHVLKNAREAILLADHAKFQSPSLFRIAELSSVSTIVTDRAPEPQWLDVLQAQNIRLIVPEPISALAAKP